MKSALFFLVGFLTGGLFDLIFRYLKERKNNNGKK